jgi:hypothetical protein
MKTEGGGGRHREGASSDHYAADRCCHTMDDTKEAQEAADRSTPPPTSDKHLKVGPPPRLPIHTEAESSASVDHVPAGAVTSEPPSNPPAGFPPFISVPEAAGSAGRAAPPAASLTAQASGHSA